MSATPALPGVEARARGHRQVSASGESHDANARRVQSPLGGVRAQHRNRPLGVAQFSGMVVSRSQPRTQHERRYSQRIQITRHLASLVIHRRVRITALPDTRLRPACWLSWCAAGDTVMAGMSLASAPSAPGAGPGPQRENLSVLNGQRRRLGRRATRRTDDESEGYRNRFRIHGDASPYGRLSELLLHDRRHHFIPLGVRM